ncbi:MAG: hypothetical protein ACWA6X_13630 [Bauldia sp.]
MASIRFGSKTINLPGSKPLRIALGVLFVLFGFVGFLPILGFWMVPVGLLILSADIPAVRRFNRRMTVKVTRWWRRIRGKGEVTA